MKKILKYTLTPVILVGLAGTYLLFNQSQSSEVLSAPTEFVFEDYAIGENTGLDLTGLSVIMANVIELKNGDYRMYFTVTSPDYTEIRYTDSTDAINWEGQGVSLTHVSDTTDREFIVGGPSVIALPNGGYRMYYRTSEKTPEDEQPNYHIRSAISDDGTAFTREKDIVMDIQDYDPDSNFHLIGHTKFFINQEGTYVGILTANFVGDNGPSDIMVTTSPDGLNWGEPEVLFKDWHDPAVVYYEGQYLMYATYLLEKQAVAVSKDGITWSKEMTPITFTSTDGIPLIIGEDGMGDLDAFVTKSGELFLYSNFGMPSKDIAAHRINEL